MEEPHTYHSSEIARAVNVNGGVDDHLINCMFVKVKEYNENVDELAANVKYNFDRFYDERQDAFRAKWKYCIARIKIMNNEMKSETDESVISRKRFQIGRLYRLSKYYQGFIVHKLNVACYLLGNVR